MDYDLLNKIIVFAIGLGSVGALIMGSGIAAMQDVCGSSRYESAGSSGYLSPVRCPYLLGYAWTILVAQAAILIASTVCFSGDISSWKVSLVGCLAVMTVLTADTANTFAFIPEQNVGQASRPRAVTAGACLCVVANLFLLIFIGHWSDGIIIPDAAFSQQMSPSVTTGARKPVSTGAVQQNERNPPGRRPASAPSSPGRPRLMTV